jgi:hypothetical protein
MTFVFLAILLLLLQGCAAPTRLAAVPVQDTTRAEIPGVPNARYWVDTDIEPFIRDAIASAQREGDYLARTGHQGPLPPIHFLAISGGGDDGAFGAGLLVGWTETGTRPEFRGVTGISTGALIAPFAFLGPEYDDVCTNGVWSCVLPDDVLLLPTTVVAHPVAQRFYSLEPRGYGLPQVHQWGLVLCVA